MSRQTYIARDDFLAATPAQTSQPEEMSQLEKALRDFHDYYERLNDPHFSAAIDRLAGTPKGNDTVREYLNQVHRAEVMKQRIERALGVWDSVKDAIGLGALPLIPIAVALGLTAAIVSLVSAGRAFLRNAEIQLAMNADRQLTYEEAAAQVDRASASPLAKAADALQWGVGAFVVYMVFKYLRG